MKRILLAVTVALVMVAMTAFMAAGPALADTTPQGNNCVGVVDSSGAPQFVSGGLNGDSASSQALEGVRGTNEQSGIPGDAANCGNNGSPFL